MRGGQLARCLTTKTRIDAETEALIPTLGGVFVDAPAALSVALRGREGGATAELGDDVAGCLRASTGGGDEPHVLATIAFDSRQDPVSSDQVFGALGSSSPQAQAVAFSCKDYGADAAVEVAPTMRAMGHSNSHANAGGQIAVCIHADAIGRTGEALTPSADAGGRVRLRNPGMGIIEDGTSYNIMATGQPHAVCVTGEVTHTHKAEGFDASEDGTGRGQPIVTARTYSICLGSDPINAEELAQPITRRNGDPGTISTGMAVRRLTPRECERLQGFPDDYTRVPNWNGWRALGADESIEQCIAEGLEVRQNSKTGKWRVKDVDGPRYKALGNSMAVPCMAWIGRRIQLVEDLASEIARAA